jgi:signal transduction histidine kinase/ActR/RegA family two-component response regulator
VTPPNHFPSSRLTARITLFFILLFSCISSYSLTDLSDNQAKAALLYNFIKHTQWPNEKGIDHLKVHFIGDNANFYNEFNKISGEITVRGKKISATHSLTFDPGKSSHILVVAESNNKQLKNITSTLVRSGTLIVSDNMKDPKIVMINFTHTKQDYLSFEVNKSNIVYEGLHISNDVLLHGGTEIEVATLYKEMESLLGKIKNDVEQNKKNLSLKLAEIDNKNAEILLLKNKADHINQQLDLQTAQFNAQQEKLLLLDSELNHVKSTLDNSKQLLLERELLVKGLEVEIRQKQNTLDVQKDQIQSQQEIVAEKTEKVSLQSATIDSQRNIIFIVLSLLFIFLLLIISRQKLALSRERQLLETRAQLIKAQAEAIAAYESSLKLKNDFLNAISHEMRTPMNGIIGALQIAKHDDPTDVSTVMDIISRCSAEMLTLVDDILTYIEIQSDQLELKPEPVSTTRFFDALRQHYLSLCQEKSLGLSWHISNNLAPWLDIDIKKFSKILHKLLDNAIKFTETGTITLIVRYEAAGTKGVLTCTVKDTGTGISTEQQQHIFDAFWQADSGLTRRHEGLGIGLTICQKLIHILGGNIDILSSEDSGTICTVTLDVTEIRNPVTLISENACPETTAPILIVEDNLINQRVLELMLDKLGYESIIANDGIEALAILDQQTPSIILMDLQMPRMDGITCTQAIRQRNDSCKEIPVIAISANLMESQQRNCMEAGMNAYLNKPVEMFELRQKLLQFIHPARNP